jgi:hypothetical protein
MFKVVFLLGSLSGFTSLTWLLLQYRDKDRNRLAVTSTRSLTGGIDVLIQYRPQRTRVGLSARATLIEPTSAHLVGGVRQERGDRYGASAVDEPLGVFAGVIYVSSDQGDQPSTAKVRLEIWTEAGPTRIAARDVEVRAIHW